MLSAWLILILHTFFFPLRLSGSSGSFPRTLKPDGDEAAREALIIHNLRLVAHIVKKYYAAASDQDDLISIGTIGLIKGISTFKPDKGVRLATYASRCIENEILMHFRAQRKTAGEVSLSDTLDAEDEGGSLSLMDVLRVDDTMLEELSVKDAGQEVRQAVARCLDDRESMVVTLRYGLTGKTPLTQREIAQQCGISRSYVSRIEKKALEKLREELERVL